MLVIGGAADTQHRNIHILCMFRNFMIIVHDMWIIFKHMHYIHVHIHVHVDVSMQMYLLYLFVIVYVFVIITLL